MKGRALEMALTLRTQTMGNDKGFRHYERFRPKYDESGFERRTTPERMVTRMLVSVKDYSGTEQ